MTFTGTFKQQKLGELQDLAWALELDEKGTKSNLLERIQGHFDLPANATLQTDKCYAVLFGKRKRTDDTSDDEPVAGPSTSSSQRRIGRDWQFRGFSSPSTNTSRSEHSSCSARTFLLLVPTSPSSSLSPTPSIPASLSAVYAAHRTVVLLPARSLILIAMILRTLRIVPSLITMSVTLQ
ncbi:hypothetical protein B0H14DRAFT_3489592 [Mycena olivaceomarginata]|nr:hypothetical protein B0H14DRAFT_3489592 [Mycena olivaceomarginata]